MDRIERVNEAIRREISVIAQRELGDPRLALATISRVEVSRDLRHAKIYFSVLGDESSARQAENGFQAAKGFIRKLLAQRVQIKFMPELNFVYDRSFAEGIHLKETIERLRDESQKSE